MCKVTFKKANGEVEMRDYSLPPASARPGLKQVHVGVLPSRRDLMNRQHSHRVIPMGTGHKG